MAGKSKSKELAEKLNSLHMQALENTAKIGRCVRHRFDTSVYAQAAPTTVAKLWCTRCKGTLDTLQAISYVRGYVTAGGPIEDVVTHHMRLFVDKARCPACIDKKEEGDGFFDVCYLCNGEKLIERADALNWLQVTGK